MIQVFGIAGMKAAAYIWPLILVLQTCHLSNRQGKSMEKTEPEAKAAPEHPGTIDFTGQIVPILIKNCSPCHFAGGKMYEKLPFDQDTTLLNHSHGILKRIKIEEEKMLLEQFIGQNKKGLH